MKEMEEKQRKVSASFDYDGHGFRNWAVGCLALMTAVAVAESIPNLKRWEKTQNRIACEQLHQLNREARCFSIHGTDSVPGAKP